MGDELQTRRLVQEAFRRTHVTPRPALTLRVRDRLLEERRRGSLRLKPLHVIAGGTVAALLVGALAVAAGVIDLPDRSLAGGPFNSRTLTHSPAKPGPGATVVLPAAPNRPAVAPYRRLDWRGQAVGWFTPPADAASFIASPDGSLIAIPESDGTSVFDSSGRLLGHVPAFGKWSADGSHAACQLRTNGLTPQLVKTVIGERGGLEQRTIDVKGYDFDFSSGWQTAGCNVSSDRLVAIRLQRELPQRPTVAEVAAMKLGSGELIAHLSYADLSAAVDPVLSHDGRNLAENDPQGHWAVIRDLLTGQVVGHVAGRVVAFSGDDQLVLTSASQPGDPHAAIVDWRWGPHDLGRSWRRDRPGRAAPRPGVHPHAGCAGQR